MYVGKKFTHLLCVCVLKILFFRQRGWEGDRVGEKHQCVVASHLSPTGDLAHNPGMSPENTNGDPLVCRPVLNPLSHTSQRLFCFFKHT